MDLRQYLDESCGVEDLRNFCADVDRVPSGKRKADLVGFVTNEFSTAVASGDTDFVEEFYDFFFLGPTKEALVALSESAGLPTTGRKAELLQRLVDHVLPALKSAPRALTAAPPETTAATPERRRNDGRKLEKDFAAFLKRERGFKTTKTRIPVTGTVSKRSYEVDVFAERHNLFWDAARVLGVLVALIAVAAFVDPAHFRQLNRVAARGISMIDRSLAPGAMLFVAFAFFELGMLGKKKTQTRVWAECKDVKAGFKREHVHKFAAAVDDVRSVTRSKEAPHLVYCVSGNRFDQDALNVAHEKGFRCFQRDGDTFKEVS